MDEDGPSFWRKKLLRLLQLLLCCDLLCPAFVSGLKEELTRRTWNIADEKKLTQSMRGSYGKVTDVIDKQTKLLA